MGAVLKSELWGGRRVAGLVALALAVRTAPAAFTGHGWDMYVWIKTAELFLEERLDIYGYPSLEGFPWGFYAYPPPWLYILSMMRVLALSVGDERWVMLLFLKAPILLFDIATGLVLLALCAKNGVEERRAFFIASLYMLNPVVVFISGVWGMFDAIPALFTALSAYFLYDRRPLAAGFSLGLAAAFKIYPAILFPAALLYSSKLRGQHRPERKLASAFFAVLLLVSAPFIAHDPSSYLDKLVFHGSNVGQFTYWALIGVLIGKDATSIIGWGVFLLILAHVLYNVRKTPLGDIQPTHLYALTLTVFLATAPKINVQYLVTALPFLLLTYAARKRNAANEVGRHLITIHAAALVFFVGSAILISYDPRALGQVTSLSLTEASLGGGLVLVSAGIAGWEYVRLLLALLGKSSLKEKLNERVGITALIAAALIVVTILPSPEGVRVPRCELRIAVIEGPDSLFQPGTNSIQPEIARNIAEPTHIVIPLSPEFFIAYKEMRPSSVVSSYFKFRLDARSWTLSELMVLVRSLRSSGYVVLAGVLTKSSDVQVFFGVQGYRSSLLDEHKDLVDSDKRIVFSSIMEGNISFAEYFSSEVAQSVRGIGFDGVFVSTLPKGLATQGDIDWVEPLLFELRRAAPRIDLIIVDGLDPGLGAEGARRLLSYADYVVLKTPLLSRQLSLQELRSSTRYYQGLSELVKSLEPGERVRLLYSVNVMDFSSGWVVPAIQTQLLVDHHGDYLDRGYVVYYVSRYLPFRLTLTQPSTAKTGS